jgi:hypothetical protein
MHIKRTKEVSLRGSDEFPSKSRRTRKRKLLPPGSNHMQTAGVLAFRRLFEIFSLRSRAAGAASVVPVFIALSSAGSNNTVVALGECQTHMLSSRFAARFTYTTTVLIVGRLDNGLFCHTVVWPVATRGSLGSDSVCGTR